MGEDGMDAERMQESEYELQYYEFNSTTFILDLKELIISTIEKYVKDLEKTVILNLTPDLIPICEKQFTDLLNAYKEVTMEKLKVAEKDIRDYFTIPKHVLLPQDADRVPCPKSNIDKLEDEIRELERAYEKQRTLKFLYEKELGMLESIDLLHGNVRDFIMKIKSDKEKNVSESMANLCQVHNQLNKFMLLESKHKFDVK